MNLLNQFMDPVEGLLLSKWIYELDCDMNLVYNVKDAESLIKQRGFPESKVFAIGNPQFDEFYKMLNTSLPPEQKKYVVYLEEGLVSDGVISLEGHIQFIRYLDDLCNKNCRKLIIKLHPRSYLYINEYTKNLPEVSFKKDVSFYELLISADKVISRYSTTLLFAFILGIPILIPLWEHGNSVPILYDENLVYYCRTKTEFKTFIAAKLKTDYNAYIAENLLPMDGKATEHIIAKILELV